MTDPARSTEPTRMPRFTTSNEGMGPYAIFYCDRCDREYRSQPSIKQAVTDNVKRGAFGGFLRNVPIVGDSIASNMENDRYRTDMTQEELQSAWGETRQYFRECPTCRQIVCIPDFDEASGYCDEDTPRRAEIEQAKAEQTLGFMKAASDVFGIGAAMRQGMEQSREAYAQQQTTQYGVGAGAGAPTPTATPGVGCASCGQTVAAGAKFCGNCGTPVPQATTCPNCSTTVAAGVRFCGNCGTKVA
jgi:hypothetical protein